MLLAVTAGASPLELTHQRRREYTRFASYHCLELTLTNNNLRNLNGLNQSRSIRKLVVDDNNLSSLMGLRARRSLFSSSRNDIEV